METAQLMDILDNSPSIKLLKMKPKNLKFFLAFLLETFEEQTAVPEEYLHQRLVNRTESKFKALFGQLKKLVEFTNEDRNKRLDLLRNKKLEIEQHLFKDII